jgi:polyprenyl P-hydroxybenzoate/phenylacrylic acid decarboxylase-like protein
LARETPLNLAHLRNMTSVTEMRGIILPPVPAFYTVPESADDIVNHTAGRVLDLFDIEHAGLVKRWDGITKQA